MLPEFDGNCPNLNLPVSSFANHSSICLECELYRPSALRPEAHAGRDHRSEQAFTGD